jgi:EF-hand domain
MPILPVQSMAVVTWALLVGSSKGFVPSTTTNFPLSSTLFASSTPSLDHPDQHFFVDDRTKKQSKDDFAASTATDVPDVAKKARAKAGGGAVHKQGVFSPVVQITKMALGEEKLNKLRAKVISLHSDVIADFVNTSDTVIGNIVLKQLFQFTDKDGNGTIDETELRTALQLLGFDWLQDKQIKGIFERADKDTNGAIDLNEWLMEAPKTLRTNLIKLAKKNGGDMGLLV